MHFALAQALTKKLSDSFRKKWERIAHMTTDRAPIGVTRMASVKALAVSVVLRW
jgi:hypothetical protein